VIGPTRPTLNNKCKADVLGDSEGGSTSKRRSGARTQAQSDASPSLSSSRTHEFSGFTHPNISLTGLAHANHSSLSNETDIIAPSLFSDDDLGENADGRMLSTPSGPRSATAAVQRAHDEVIEIIDMGVGDKNNDIEPGHKPIMPSCSQRNMFRKRSPMSLLPAPMPTRVRTRLRVPRGGSPCQRRSRRVSFYSTKITMATTRMSQKSWCYLRSRGDRHSPRSQWLDDVYRHAG
jgi:hypothetical protein